VTEGPYKLPEGWRWVRLGEVCSKPQYGLTQAASQESVGPKFVRITDITSGQINWDTVPYCRIDQRTLEKYLLAEGDLLFARSGSVGATLLIREKPPYDAVFASYLIRVRVNHSVALPEFVDLFIRSSFGQAQIIPQGAAQKNINAKLIQQLLIPLPPLEEQRRIVAKVEELMSRIREAKRLRQEAKEEADRLWQAVLAQTFPRPGQDLPEGWRWVRLGEVCKTKMGATPSTKVPNYWDPPEIVWVTPEDMEKGELNFVASSRRLISSKGLKKIGARLFPKGTVLLSTTATIGKVGVALKPLSANQQISALTCIANDDPLFVAYYLLSLGERGLRRLGGTATATHINQTNLRLLPIPLPPLEEQRRIVAHLQAVQEKIKALKEAQAQTEAELKRLEQAILDKAFRGELQ